MRLAIGLSALASLGVAVFCMMHGALHTDKKIYLWMFAIFFWLSLFLAFSAGNFGWGENSCAS